MVPPALRLVRGFLRWTLWEAGFQAVPKGSETHQVLTVLPLRSLTAQRGWRLTVLVPLGVEAGQLVGWSRVARDSPLCVQPPPGQRVERGVRGSRGPQSCGCTKGCCSRSDQRRLKINGCRRPSHPTCGVVSSFQFPCSELG